MPPLVHLIGMMQLLDVLITILLLLSLPSLVLVKGNSISQEVQQNLTAGLSSSPWFKKIVNHNSRDDLRDLGCWNKPWICDQGEFPPRRRCCRNRCIDVSSDINNCGACGLRCLFNWQCCRGQCTNTNISPFNCGRCENICPFRVPCFYGMCGYAQPFPPRPPFPFPPKPPHPPFPFPPKPPRPPFPFPPKPPQPEPPHPPLPTHPQKGWQPPATQ